MMQTETQAALRALLRDKVHVRPGTLARLPSSQADSVRSPLALGRLLLQPFSACPAPLLRLWARHPRGHAVINPEHHEYRPGLQTAGKQTLDGVAWIAAGRLLEQPDFPRRPLVHLWDHLLGCDGDPGGPWLSDGGGRSVDWAEIGRRLQRQFALGYGPAEVMSDPHRYFAWGIQAFLADRQALNIADPGLERLLRLSLFDLAFWERAGAG